MILQQFYLNCLAHASYLIGSKGVAAVIEGAASALVTLPIAKAVLHTTGAVTRLGRVEDGNTDLAGIERCLVARHHAAGPRGA